MSEPVFSRAGDSRLYLCGSTAAYLAATELGDTAELTRTWADTRGTYLFLGAAMDGWEGFLATLQNWIGDYAPLGAPRFLWIADPQAPTHDWQTRCMAGKPRDGIWTTNGAAFQLPGYEVVVDRGGAVAPADTDAGWGFTVADSEDRPAVTFSSPDHYFPARRGTALLSMDPGGIGAWRFVIDAPEAEGDAFHRLGAGIRYFVPGEGDRAEAVHFAVLRQPTGEALAFYCQIDPVRALDGERTSVGLLPWTPGAADAVPALPSGFATVLGRPVTLRPLAGAADSTTPARLVFGTSPSSGYHYLVPDGPFAVEAGPDGGRVVCGTSGLEYLAVPAEGCALVFVPGRPAYAPLDDQTDGKLLTARGTTSWLCVEAGPATTGVTYYSQPEDAPLYSAAGAQAAGGLRLLGYHEVPAAAAGRTPWPMVPFPGLDPEGGTAVAVAIEERALAPVRHAVLLPGTREAAPGAVPTVAVTPQGLAVGLASDDSWDWLGIGHDGEGAAALPSLRFTRVTGPFRQAMQTNQLFMVIGHPEEFHRAGSVAYQLTEVVLNVIATIPANRGGVRREVLLHVREAMIGRQYETRGEFLAALLAASPGIDAAEEQLFLRYGGQLTPVAGGWPFRLSPDSWRPQTFLITKFVLGRSVADLVDDLATWAWPEAAGRRGPAEAQAAIRRVIEQARAAGRSSAYASFVELVDDPDWTGVLALSVEVPLEQLPAELQVLAAGIDPGAFVAHHFGISATPFELADGTLRFERSSMFGLIDYRNPQDQYSTENIAYAFRVMQLTVGIRNSVVAGFTSQVELLINRLFGAATRLLPTTHGNNILLDGALQRQQLPDGSAHDAYVFSMTQQNTFRLDGLVLQSVELLTTQLVTAKASDPAAGNATVAAVFQLTGNLRFYEPEGFDPFCWGEDSTGRDGYLRFGGLAIAMSFDLGDPEGTTMFTVSDGNLSFDAANSRARPEALVSRFPIRLNGLLTTPDPELTGAPTDAAPTPADLGYVSISTPLDQSLLTQPWYGLEYTVDLGTLGALAGSKPLALRLLVAWSPGADGDGDGEDGTPAVYLGVRLPGAKGLLGVSLPLQGVVKLGFRSVEFLTHQEPKKPRTYTLRLRDFALRLLGLTFPPGHNDVILFGNPDQSGSSKVGWYLAYASDSDPKRLPPAAVQAALRMRDGG